MNRNKQEFQQIEHRGSLIKVARSHNVWLGVVDIVDHAPLNLTIEKVIEYKNGKFPGGRTKDGQAIKFKGGTKLLNLNATNIARLAKLVGVDPKDLTADQLVGLRVILDVEPLPREFNGHTHGTRIQTVRGAS